MRILVVAAVADELCGLPGAVLGVGLVPAAVAAARLFQREAPEGVILVGTAGAYTDIAVGTVVTARTLGLVSGTATLGLGYVPLAPGPLITALRAPVPEVDVATLLAITTGVDLAVRLAVQWQVEHMEVYGVAAAAAAAGIPFGAVFGITNRVGPDAHAQWRTHRVACQAAAAAAVAPLLSGR